MSETQWYVEQSSTWGLCVRTRERQREVMVAKGQPRKTEDGYVAYRLESKKEAHLIAAAPDLYAALELAVLGKVVSHWLTAGANVCLVCGELPDSSAHHEHCWVPLAEAALARARGEA